MTKKITESLQKFNIVEACNQDGAQEDTNPIPANFRRGQLGTTITSLNTSNEWDGENINGTSGNPTKDNQTHIPDETPHGKSSLYTLSDL